MKPGGILVLTTPNIAEVHSRVLFLLRGCWGMFRPESIASSGHITPMPWWLVEDHARRAGFEVLALGTAGRRPRGWAQELRNAIVKTILRLLGKKSANRFLSGVVLTLVARRHADESPL